MPRRRQLQKPRATISCLADQDASPQMTTTVAKDVIERVKKCFARANHEHANEQEARAASKMARKIMEQYQISQADIMIDEDASQREKRGGMSAVDIWPAKDGGRACTPGWVDWLNGAISNFFDCNCFSTNHGDRIEWTFYGIAMHTISAAIAFEAVHNQIQDWSERFTGIPVRNSYCLGVADGLLTLSKDEKKRTERQARQAEAQMLAAKIRQEDAEEDERLSRLRTGSSLLDDAQEMIPDDEDKPNETDANAESGVINISDDEGPLDDPGQLDEVMPDFFESSENAEVDIQADFDDELQKFVVPDRNKDQPNRMPSPTNGNEGAVELDKLEFSDDLLDDSDNSEQEDLDDAKWASMRQLSTFRQMSRDIEDDVLKTNNIKLTKARKANRAIKDKTAFEEGREDSHKIEIRAARIEAGAPQSSGGMDMSQ
ncbi:MAG: hypothetical protein LQ337_004844 [Flavoplaca oasis]|nr:MAG: hypothetical protein LQ337_004844 [Flavoplaca oasis]